MGEYLYDLVEKKRRAFYSCARRAAGSRLWDFCPLFVGFLRDGSKKKIKNQKFFKLCLTI